MGTFKILPVAIVSNTWTIGSGTALGVFQPGAPNSSTLAFGGLVRVSFNPLTSVYLDGAGAPTPYNNLPVGFNILSTRLNPPGAQNTGDGSAHWYLQFSEIEESAADQGFYDWPNIILPSIATLLLNGMGVRGDGDSILSHVFLTTLAGGSYISGTYNIYTPTQPIVDAVHYPEKQTTLIPRSFSMGGVGGVGGGTGKTGSKIPNTFPPGSVSPGYNFPPLVVLPELTTNGGTLIPPATGTDAAPNQVLPANMGIAGNVTPSDIIRITSLYPAVNSINLTEVTQIQLTWVDGLGVTQTLILPDIYWFYFITTVIIFQIPPFIEIKLNDPTIPNWPVITITPIIVISGTTFSGSIPLTPFVITLADASGIYSLTPGKTNDTVYDNVNPPETIDVKIPNPFIKTGFIGG